MTVYVRTPYGHISHMMRHPQLTIEQSQENKHVHFPVDVMEDENKFTIVAVLPGINPKDIDIQIQDKKVRLRGEFKEDNTNDTKFFLRERPAGKFDRAISLPDLLNTTKAEAKMENGILSLSIPKSEEALPKKIKVTAI